MRLLLSMVCGGVLVAQAADPMRWIPADCVAVVRSHGPALWQRDFGETGVGKVLASPALAPKWTKLLHALAGSVGIGEGERTKLARLPELLGDYRGEMVAGLWCDWAATKIDADMPVGAAILALGPDEDTDLAELAERLGEMLPAVGDREVEVDGRPTPLRRIGELQLVGPVVADGCLVMILGTDLASQTRHFFDADDVGVFELADEVRQATCGMQIAAKAAIAAVTELAMAQGERDGQARFMQLMQAMGLGAITNVTATMFPDGKYVGQNLTLEFEGEDRGLIGLLLPARRTRPSLLQFLPPSASTYTVAPLDGRALQEFYPIAFELFAEEMPMTREELEQQFTQFTKLRLIEDVLALIGDGYMRIDDVATVLEYDEDATEEEDALQDEVANSCFVLEVRDGKTFAKNLDTAIRARGLHVGRKSEDYGGAKIYRMTLAGMFPVEYAVTDSFVVVGVGESEMTRRHVRGVLDAAVAGDAAPVELASAVQQRLAGLPGDWSGIAVASWGEFLEGWTGSFADWEALVAEDDLSTEDLEGPWWAGFELAKALRPELARHGAGTIVSVDYLTRSSWRSRMRW